MALALAGARPECLLYWRNFKQRPSSGQEGGARRRRRRSSKGLRASPSGATLFVGRLRRISDRLLLGERTSERPPLVHIHLRVSALGLAAGRARKILRARSRPAGSIECHRVPSATRCGRCNCQPASQQGRLTSELAAAAAAAAETSALSFARLPPVDSTPTLDTTLAASVPKKGAPPRRPAGPVASQTG